VVSIFPPESRWRKWIGATDHSIGVSDVSLSSQLDCPLSSGRMGDGKGAREGAGRIRGGNE